tara:strand:- start:11952 stop:12155 length:204 start_codon:yes stop_codon:yes gene_type:complete
VSDRNGILFYAKLASVAVIKNLIAYYDSEISNDILHKKDIMDSAVFVFSQKHAHKKKILQGFGNLAG